MQIHELNDFTGELGSGAFIVVDDGEDTGKVSTAELLSETNQSIDDLDDSLNARIDNIIAPQGEPSLAELVDVRLGADGVTYATAGEAVRAQFTDVKAELNGAIVMPQSPATIIQGTFGSGGGVTDRADRIRVSGLVSVKKGERITFTAGTNTTQLLVGYFDLSKVYQNESPWYLDGSETIIKSDGYVALAFRKDNANSNISPSDYDAVTTIIPYLKNLIDQTDEQLSALSANVEDFKSQIADDTVTTAYAQVPIVHKNTGYIWGNAPTSMEKTLVAQNNRVAVEFEAKPNTPYVIQGMYAGTTQSYGIGFFASDTDKYSTSHLFNATQVTWNGNSRCVLFTTPADCHYIRYNEYPNDSYDKQLEGYSVHAYEIDESAIPDTIQRASDNTLETTNKTIVGAINEIFDGGSSGSFIPWSLAPSGDDDMTSAILAKLNTYGICQLQAGTYVVTNLDMPAKTSLIGVGSSSILKLSGTDSTGGYAVKLNTECAVKNLKIIGSDSSITMSSSLVNRHGILWQGTYGTDQTAPHRATVENVWIERFKGGGITCRDTGTPVNNCINVSDVFIQECRAGINVSYSSEFNRFENVHCYGCYYGCVNNGGNNTYVNCSFSSNTLGFIMGSISDGITLSNTQHGSAIGCVINHSHANNGTGIKVDGGSNGFIFSGCQLFYSAIDLDNTSGIVFDAMDIGAIGINIDDCAGAILFTNCMFGSAPTVSKSNSPNVATSNCYVRSTGASVTI